MSMMCNCPKCGGDDEFAICENELMQARIDLEKSRNRQVLLVSFTIFAIGVACAIGSYSLNQSAIVDVQSLPVGISDNSNNDPVNNWEFPEEAPDQH